VAVNLLTNLVEVLFANFILPYKDANYIQNSL